MEDIAKRSRSRVENTQPPLSWSWQFSSAPNSHTSQHKLASIKSSTMTIHCYWNMPIRVSHLSQMLYWNALSNHNSHQLEGNSGKSNSLHPVVFLLLVLGPQRFEPWDSTHLAFPDTAQGPSFCLTPFFLQLARLYPNMELELEVSPESAPFLRISPRNVTLVPVMNIQAFALLPSSSDRKTLFLVKAVSLITAGAAKGHACQGRKPLPSAERLDRCWRLFPLEV